MKLPRHHHLNREATSLDAALVGVGVDIAAPPLARLGHELRGRDLGPDSAFTSNLRQQLLAAASVAPAGLAPTRAERAPAPTVGVGHVRTHTVRWFATRLTAGLAAAGVLVTGVGVASARALPGDALYGVKRDTEGLQLDLAHGDGARGLLHLQFAASRLSEVHALLHRAGVTETSGSAPTAAEPVPSTLAATLRSTLSAMDADTATGASELTHSYLEKRQPASLTKLAAFTSQQENALTAVLPALPPPAAAASLDVLHTVAAQTTALLTEPTGPAPAAAPAGSPEATTSPSPQGEAAAPAPTPSASPSPRGSATPTAATATPSDDAGSETPSSSPSVATSPSATPPASATSAASDDPQESPSPSLSPTSGHDSPSPSETP